MDADRFDALTRTLTTGWHRRALVAAAGVAIVPLLRGAEAAAHDRRKKCNKKSGKRKKRCLEKARAHNAQHAVDLVAPPPPDSPPPPPSPPPPGCTPTTCVEQGKNCGTIGDGCGGTLACGACSAPQTCGEGNPGVANICGCGNSACPAGANCGTIANVCGGAIACGPSCGDPMPVCDRNTCRVCAADRECCGISNAGTWCQGGECVRAGGSLTNCQGRCGGSVSICGRTVDCPDCDTCASASCLGGSGMACNGPFGRGLYCVSAGTLESCDDETPCTTPGQICCGNTCFVACT